MTRYPTALAKMMEEDLTLKVVSELEAITYGIEQ